MAENKVNIQIQATDGASQNISKVSKSLSELQGGGEKAGQGLNIATVALGSFIANIASNALSEGISRLKSIFNDSINDAAAFERQIVSASIVFPRLGVNANDAIEAAKNLGKELRIGTAPALEGLQKLLKSGLNLQQAADLMRRFTNEAVTGKSANISLSNAVQNLVDMYYMELSALGNLSGISENVSVIKEKGLKLLQQEGKYLGLTIGKLDEAAQAEAKYRGFIDLTNQTLGSSQALTGTYSDKLAELESVQNELSIQLGQKLLPFTTKFKELQIELTRALGPLIERFGQLISRGFQRLQEFANRPDVQKFLAQIAQKINELLPKIQEFVNNFISGISKIAEVVLPIIGGVLQAVLPIIIDVAGFILQHIGYAINTIGNIFTGLRDWFNFTVGRITDGLSFLFNFFGNIFNGIRNIIGGVVDFFRQAWESGVNFVSGIFGNISKAVSSVFSGVVKFIVDIINSVISKINNAIIFVNRIINGINSTFNLQIGKIGQIPYLSYASGTMFSGEGLAMVGERGPELVSMPRGSTVYNTEQTKYLTTNNNQKINIYNNIYTNIDVDLLNRKLYRLLIV